MSGHGTKRKRSAKSSSGDVTRMPKVYRNYGHADWSWDEVLHAVDVALSGRPPGNRKQIADRYGIEPSVLRKRYAKWVAGGRGEDGTGDNRGGQNRSFSQEEEESMAAHVRSQFIDRGLPFVDSDMAHIALGLRPQFGLGTRIHPNFRGSHRWVTRFKRVHGFVSRVPKLNRLAVKRASEEDIQHFKDECSDWLNIVGSDLFMNLDESCWRVVNKTLLVWNIKGQVPRCRCYFFLLLPSSAHAMGTLVWLDSSPFVRVVRVCTKNPALIILFFLFGHRCEGYPFAHSEWCKRIVDDYLCGLRLGPEVGYYFSEAWQDGKNAAIGARRPSHIMVVL
jgi:hypothetical protein